MDEPEEQPTERGVGVVRGIGKEPEKPLQDYWSDALRAAAYSMEPEDEPGEFRVTTYVCVNRNSPGWVDGFIVKLS